MHFKSPQKGEVVVFKYPEDESIFFIKRVIGVPGDKISWDGQQLMVKLPPNRQLTQEGWLYPHQVKSIDYRDRGVSFVAKLEDDDLRGLIVEETGMAEDAQGVTMVINCIKALKRFATFEAPETATITKMGELAKIPAPAHVPNLPPPPSSGPTIGLRLGYTINLNLPATSDVAVFNAIFKSLKENLLEATKDGNE